MLYCCMVHVHRLPRVTRWLPSSPPGQLASRYKAAAVLWPPYNYRLLPQPNNRRYFHNSAGHCSSKLLPENCSCCPSPVSCGPTSDLGAWCHPRPALRNYTCLQTDLFAKLTPFRFQPVYLSILKVWRVLSNLKLDYSRMSVHSCL